MLGIALGYVFNRKSLVRYLIWFSYINKTMLFDVDHKSQAYLTYCFLNINMQCVTYNIYVNLKHQVPQSNNIYKKI